LVSLPVFCHLAISLGYFILFFLFCLCRHVIVTQSFYKV
jgi:hypothetical protein